MGSVIRSLIEDQHEIIRSIETLHVGGSFEADCTYGNGSFYEDREPPRLKFDIDPQVEDVVKADSRALPLADKSLSSLMFDPPFLIYVRQDREGNGKMIMARRFSGYWRYDELEEHYEATIKEASRVLKKDGVLVVKCQDIVHNHRLHATHARVIQWGEKHGFRLLDLFVLGARHRLPHSYFVVLKRT